MSDAITLDVLSSSPVQLDAGDADPIAREEIAALATRVTTVEGDVSGLSTRMGAVEGDVTALDGRMDTAEGDISTLGTTVDGIDARVEAIEADYVTAEDVMGALGGEAPTLVAGSSRAVLGDPETASWMERTTAADGAALIESICGNTIVQDGSLLPVRMEGVETVAADESWSSQLAIPASTYFPDGMRSAGSVRDELTEHEAIHKVGEYTFTGEETWWQTDDGSFYFESRDNSNFASAAQNSYVTATFAGTLDAIHLTYNSIRTLDDKRISAQNYTASDGMDISRFWLSKGCGSSVADVQALTAGKTVHYALTTPTTQAIDPPLPMSYRVGAGGTERVMVASGSQSAPPVFATRYPLDPADLAASIAPVDGPTAESNHAVGDLVMLGWTLCKVTTAIARGETITIGTNVTRTSVAAEIAALS